MRQKLKYTPEQIVTLIDGKMLRNFGRDTDTATKNQIYKATALVVRDIMSELWLENHDLEDSHMQKQVYYLSMEFLPGPSLKNNIFNLGLEKVIAEAVDRIGGDLKELYDIEPDAGLGNGGLGRLASCYLDAIASNGMAGHGLSICYEYGIFKQKIVDCMQKEEADDWLTLGDVWLIRKEEEQEEVRFGGTLKEVWDHTGKMRVVHSDYITVIGTPRDMLITGYDSDVVNTLRLWESSSPISIDMELFSQGKYQESMFRKYQAEVISKILYPEDAHDEGKILRMSQQYFFISASMQALAKRHLIRFGTLDNFYDKVAVHINDTHPTMAIPELMRIFMDEYEYEWDKAWEIVSKTVSYTNHTVMSEALEKWPEHLFAKLLPRIHSIIAEINRRLQGALIKEFPHDEGRRNEMSIIYNGSLRMANLCVAAAHKVNGVSALHSGIIKDKLFPGFATIAPDKFTNVTNGIAYRRWLCQANPKMSNLIDDLIGPAYRKDAMHLENLLKYKDDREVLNQFATIKRENKLNLANYIKEHNKITVNPDSIFDVQVKRLHEYKRQLLNILHIIYLYNQLRENPNLDMEPRTFIFGAKASAGYKMAKEIIKLACHLSNQLEKDPLVKGRLKIVFLENYSVSLSELIMPAADISEQISLAGKEASGTGNMKLMINGAVTLGTMDGANVEIYQAVGAENMFLFGMRVDEVEQLVRSGAYRPWNYCQNDSNIASIIRTMSEGIDGVGFGEIINSLTAGFNGNGDTYFVLADFDSYRNAQCEVQNAYRDKLRWGNMSLTNIAKAGIFSADRAVKEYADRIWGIQPINDSI